jgi:hypothetical protein
MDKRKRRAMTRINSDHIFWTHCHRKHGEIKPEPLRRSAEWRATILTAASSSPDAGHGRVGQEALR